MDFEKLFLDLKNIIDEYKDLKDDKFVSPYHLEPNVYCHILMVANEVLKDFDNLSEQEKILFLITAFLHDIGKAKCLQYNKKKNYWMTPKHENYSMYLSISHLKNIQKKYNLNNFIDILYLINYHGILWQKSEKQIQQLFSKNIKLFEYIKKFSKYDNDGRISFNKKYFDYKIKKSEKNINFELPTITLMVGLPGSGKDYFIQHNNELKNQKVLSRDDIMMELYGDRGNYTEVWNSLTEDEQKNIDKELMKRFSQYRKQNKDFVINLTNLSIKSRKKWWVKNYNYKIIVMLPELKIIKKRLNKRYKETGKFIPNEIIDNMIKRFELPLYNEFENIIDISIFYD